MNDIKYTISHTMAQLGLKAKTVSITHLQEIREAVGNLIEKGLVHKSIIEAYSFYSNNDIDLSNVNTILSIAIPHALTRIWFKWKGKSYPADIPPDYFGKAALESYVESILKNTLETAGFNIIRAQLPLKTLAVRSGLATYGKNNITYIPGSGSLHVLVAFYTDWIDNQDNWGEAKAMKQCENCLLCHDNCPTRCIPTNRFLIHAEKCASFLNETKPDSAYWARLQSGSSNALIGCTCCQTICPANSDYIYNINEGPTFSQQETGMILKQTPFNELPYETRNKLDGFLEGIYESLAPNLDVLIKKQGQSS